MEYTVSKENLLVIVGREVSRVAASEYDEAGRSLYDGIALSSRDRETVESFVDEAAACAAARLRDIAEYSEGKLTLTVPDLPSGTEAAVASQLDRYIVSYAADRWLQRTCPGRAELYAQERDAALELAVRTVRTREKVTR